MTTLAKSAFGTHLRAGDFTTGTGGIHGFHIAAPGTGYSDDDVLTVAGGTGGTFKVTHQTAGAVDEIQQLTFGAGYSTGDTKATSVLPPGGSDCTIHVTSLCVPIAELRNVTPGPMKAEPIDVTNMDSAGWREYITSIKDAGEVAVDGNFLSDATQDWLLTDQIAGTLRTYLISPADLSWLYTVDGFVQGLPIEAKFDDALRFSCTIKASGAASLGDMTVSP